MNKDKMMSELRMTFSELANCYRRMQSLECNYKNELRYISGVIKSDGLEGYLGMYTSNDRTCGSIEDAMDEVARMIAVVNLCGIPTSNSCDQYESENTIYEVKFDTKDA